MAKSNSTHINPSQALDRLAGYSGSIQGTPLDTALDEQRSAIREAQAIIDCATASMREHFADWPEPLALTRASKILQDAVSALDAGVLEDRGLSIARARSPEGAATREGMAHE